MADFTVEGQEYDWPEKLTLGESRILKRLTGKHLSELENMRGDDPDVLTALILIAMRREHPDMTVDDVERIEVEDIKPIEELPVTEETPEEVDADVPPALALGAPASDVETEASSEPETTLESSGTPS